HARQRPVRAPSRPAQSRAPGTRAAQPRAARARQADAAFDAWRRTPNNPIPALPRARGDRFGERLPGRAHLRSGARVRGDPRMEESQLARKGIGLLCALLSACATQDIAPSSAPAADPAPAAPPSQVFEAPRPASPAPPAPAVAAIPGEKPQLLDAARMTAFAERR